MFKAQAPQATTNVPEPLNSNGSRPEELIIRDRDGRERRVRVFRGQDGHIESFLEEEQKEEEVTIPQLPPYSAAPEPTPTAEGGASLRQKFFQWLRGENPCREI